MSDILLLAKNSPESFTGYYTVEQPDGSSSTYDSPMPVSTEAVWGTGVQKTPGFKSRRGIARQKPGPAYHKYGWIEAKGTRRQASNFSDSSYFYQNNPNWPVPGTYTNVIQEHQNSGTFPNILETQTNELVDEVSRLATGKLLDQLKGDGTNLANMLGERKQLENQIVTTMRRLGNTALALKRRDLKAATRYLFGDGRKAVRLKGKVVADWWLELQYGWKPLLSDVYGLVTESHKREASRVMAFRASSSQQIGFQSGQSWAIDPLGKNCSTVVSQARAKYVVMASPDGILSAPASLGFTNPLEVAWEVTPWSFVVDWFLPIGSYLDQLSADHGWTFYDGGYSYLVKEWKSFEWDHPTGPFVQTYDWPYSGRTQTSSTQDNASGNSYFWRFERSHLSGFPAARLPRLKNPFSPAHFANALALLGQIFSGGTVRKHG